MFKATNQRRLRPPGESNMQNTIRTTRITARSRFALLALGAISLSAAMASPASAQFVDPNASGCRSAIGIAVNRGCLSVKPENNGAARDRSNDAAAGLAVRENLGATLAEKQVGIIDSPGVAHYDSEGKIRDVEYPALGITDHTIPSGIMREYPDSRGYVFFPSHNGGNGGAAGHKGSRVTDTRTGATAAPPQAAATTIAVVPKGAAVPKPDVPKSVTMDKATNTLTRDHRTGATAAPGGPPPAAAIGTKSTAAAPQVAAQPTVRDHRH
jgi:hypothetical protein